ncbi:MAG TPA: hypothetical protein VE978_21145, partial [Chitinophagales bacterium]|nr:hypothetical protein [Chitinophagales bacterium]
MKKFLFLLLFISNFSLFSPNGSFGQIPLLKQWDMRYGGTAWDCLNYEHKEIPFSQTSDRGYILAGVS